MDKIKKFFKQFLLIINLYDRLIFLKNYVFEYSLFLCRYTKSFFGPPPKKILLIMLFGIGDVVGTTPVIEKLKKRYPFATIDYLTKYENFLLLKYNPFLDRLLTESDEAQILLEGYDLVVNFQLYDNSLFIKTLMGKINCKKVLGSAFDKGGHYRHLDDFYVRTRIEKLCHTAMVPYRHNDMNNVRIYLPADWQEKLACLRKELGIDRDGNYLGINLGSNYSVNAKLWFRNYSVSFLRRMLEYFTMHYPVILTGRSAERREDEKLELKRITSDLPGVICLTDKLDLEKLVLVIKLCRCYISSDTGILHISRGVGTPFVGLFGQSSGRREVNPERFTKGWSALQSGFKCSPCYWRISSNCLECKRALCMEEFSIDTIASEVRRLMQAQASPVTDK